MTAWKYGMVIVPNFLRELSNFYHYFKLKMVCSGVNVPLHQIPHPICHQKLCLLGLVCRKSHTCYS